jgi:hypothetical protein
MRSPWTSPSEQLGRLAAAALPSPPDDSGPSFGAFLAATRARRRTRPLPLALAVVVHAGLLTYGVVKSFWRVDEVKAPALMVVISPHLPPTPPPPAGGHTEEAVTPTAKRPPLHRTIFPVKVEKKVAATNPEPGTAEGTGTGARCPPGVICDGPPIKDPPQPPVVVSAPPDVGEKSCLDCPRPHLPPAFRRLGLKQSILVRICADRAGHVTRTQVLRGIDAGADEGVTRTIESWRFSPYVINGNPVPFCYVSNFVFTTE